MPGVLCCITVLVLASAAYARDAVRPATTVRDAAGVETVEFTLTKQDKQAIRDLKRSARLERRAERARQEAANIELRISMVQALLDEAAGEEQRLRDALSARLVAEYKSSSSRSGWGLIASSHSLRDFADRTVIHLDDRTRTESLAQARQQTIARMEDLQLALEELRDLSNDKATRLEMRSDELSARIEQASDAHMEASTMLTGEPATGGTWMVDQPGNPDYSSLAGTFGGVFGGTYNGGTITPREPATPDQIARVLADTRISIYAGGISDIRAGRVDARVLDALSMMAARFGQLSVTSLISGHGVYTSSGNISEHTYGCAVDIGTLNGIVITPASQGPGSITEQGVQFLAGLQGRLAPHQVISLFSYGGPTLGMADHDDHIHLGYHC